MSTDKTKAGGTGDSVSEAVTPEQLLAVFSKGRIVLWIGVAVAIHVVLIAVTSVGYIRDRWIDPEGAKDRKKAAAVALAAEKAKAQPAMPSAAKTNSPTAPAAKAVTAKQGDAAQLEARRDTKVVKRITEVAATNAIPKAPDLGISLEDTNLK